MKKLKYIFPIAFLTVASFFTACSPEDDQELPQHNKIIYLVDFQQVVDATFDESLFTNFSEAGTKKWFGNKDNRGNGYYEFSPFQSNQPLNIGWFITPAINLDEANAKRLTFQSAQHHVINDTENYLELFVSNNFTGDVTTATWVKFEFKKPQPNSKNYDWVNSGAINLAQFSGNIHIAFKATGGTASANAGAYMIDNIKVF